MNKTLNLPESAYKDLHSMANSDLTASELLRQMVRGYANNEIDIDEVKEPTKSTSFNEEQEILERAAARAKKQGIPFTKVMVELIRKTKAEMH